VSTRVREVRKEAARASYAPRLKTLFEQELRGGEEEDPMPSEHGLMGEVLRDHCFAQALGRDEDEVAGGREELEAEGRLDGGTIDAGRPGPVEIGHRGKASDPRPRQAAFEATPGAFLLLLGDEVFEQLNGTPPSLGGQGDEVVEVGGGMVQAEGVERVIQWGHGASLGRDAAEAARRMC